MRTVTLLWEGPLDPTQVSRGWNGSDDYGIYVVYGRHVVFGPGAMLYIGRSVERTFGTRFREHLSWLQHEDEIVVRMARLSPGDYQDDDDWAELVCDIERLAIYWHSPPYNSSGLNRYPGQALRVLSWQNRGSILPEFSSEWPQVHTRGLDEDEDC